MIMSEMSELSFFEMMGSDAPWNSMARDDNPEIFTE